MHKYTGKKSTYKQQYIEVNIYTYIQTKNIYKQQYIEVNYTQIFR